MGASSMLKYATTMLFMFSTVYTLAFYYYGAEGVGVGVDSLSDSMSPSTVQNPQSDEGFMSSLVGGMVDEVIEALSWFSPFAVIKGLMVTILPPAIYQPINLLLLRPLGWIGAWITTEWIINKLRGSSES